MAPDAIWQSLHQRLSAWNLATAARMGCFQALPKNAGVCEADRCPMKTGSWVVDEFAKRKGITSCNKSRDHSHPGLSSRIDHSPFVDPTSGIKATSTGCTGTTKQPGPVERHSRGRVAQCVQAPGAGRIWIRDSFPTQLRQTS